ncbi:unnamed protein product (macronuclear) [Paramecium tetraurelia]|uniref:Nudix hydrolase domain-containing protein n=1 Tax=Paramecium tetraurelia TaxID=5888 RepID=A0CL52_PARTE|nr:uncharacterized protein GSPATT00008066001 [Paramecium tetraurelia]CAK71519.1 unnamed protein product [Paramecium tetraurelia]|eukprot:XP_001438916.1 hypothetical protein (macronuclear) [Paramecium tetraurelia strain d4-2]
MQNITGSGVMVFIKHKEDTLVLLLQNIRKRQLVLMEPGGNQEVGLSSMSNALKELYEETFAGLSKSDLDEEHKVLVNYQYLCYAVYIKIDDLNFFQEVMGMNQKILQMANSRSLHSFNECKGFNIANLKDLMNVDFQYYEKDNNKIPLHIRTQASLKEFQAKKIIQKDLSIQLPLFQCSLDKIRIKNPKSPLHVLNNQYTYVIH